MQLAQPAAHAQGMPGQHHRPKQLQRKLTSVPVRVRARRYTALTPFSIILDIMRISGSHHERGHGWLVFFTIADMLVKVRAAGRHECASVHRKTAKGWVRTAADVQSAAAGQDAERHD